jgi:acetyl-CoA carboxylase biotin carboxyl carrier protein
MNKTERKTKREDELLRLDEVRELIELVSEKGFSEFELVRGSFRMRLSRGQQVLDTPLGADQSQEPGAAATETGAVNAGASAAQPAPRQEAVHLVTSPIVGTFYDSPAPTAEPFVKVGDTIAVGQTLCVIEAMKLMNEIQSDASGTLATILVENGKPVEYGQPLFGIKK